MILSLEMKLFQTVAGKTRILSVACLQLLQWNLYEGVKDTTELEKANCQITENLYLGTGARFVCDILRICPIDGDGSFLVHGTRWKCESATNGGL